MTFDLREVPFSLRGSWLAFSLMSERQMKPRGLKAGLYLRTMQGAISGGREIFELTLDRNGRALPMKVVGTPSVLRVACGKGCGMEAVFSSTRQVLLRGTNASLVLEAEPVCYATLRPAGDRRWEANLMAQRIQLMLRAGRGHVSIVAPWSGAHSERIRYRISPDATGTWELVIDEFFTAWPAETLECQFDAARRSAEADFSTWLDETPEVSRPLKKIRQDAAYIQWASLVEPRGFLQRETMLMSKNWMTNVWSWDHCFNALALLPHHPRLAWDQWAVVFDLQNDAGALPDCANNADVVWNFCKPPIHGWALGRMRATGLRLSRERRLQACRWLERWTEWWLRYRDDDGDGLPQYNHGNDSGWDNASCFSMGMPVEGPDLATFLILQMEEIASLHFSLGDRKKAARWMRRASQMLARLQSHSWRENRFVAMRSGDHVEGPGDSLIPFLPLLLGARLSARQRGDLLEGLNRFLTPYGLATENPASPFYDADGYWRGPVWAPPTYLMIEALRGCGEERLAGEISRRFCAACAKGGLAENFNALTGEGLRDRAYSWTASVFLLLASSSSTP